MTNIEFDPIIDGLKDAQKLGAWLVAHQARLDVSECLGLAANRLIVEDASGIGRWSIPLVGAIDMVDTADGWFATESPADIRIKGQRGAEPIIEVFHTGIDDEIRRATVDTDAIASFEPIPIIPNN